MSWDSRRVHTLSDEELTRLPTEERDWIRTWRESEKTGKKYNESHGYGMEEPRSTTSLDRPYAQLRQRETGAISNEKILIEARKAQGTVFGDSLGLTTYYFNDEWEKIIEDKEKWQAAMENCHLILRNKKPSDPRGIVAQCGTRFSKKKKKITHWRMEQLSQRVQKGGFRFGLEITLTTDPKRAKDLADVGEKWKLCGEHFMDFANARLRRAGKKATTCYLRAAELTESGLLHFHIGFFGPGITGKIPKKNGTRDYIFPYADIRALWDRYGMAEQIWVKRAPVTDVTNYVTKHVSKSWGGTCNEMLEAFLHYSGMRQWTSSKGAVPKEPPSVERWELVAVAFTPGEALLFREDLLADGCKLIRDDLSSGPPDEV